VPPSENEVLDSSKSRCDRLEKELQRAMEGHDDVQEDMEAVLSVLMEIKDGHPHALFSAGMDPDKVADMETLLDQVRKSGEEERYAMTDGGDESSIVRGGGAVETVRNEEEELQLIEDSLLPPDDEVEWMLSKIVGLDPVKNHIRGLRRTIEMDNLANIQTHHNKSSPTSKNNNNNNNNPTLPRHIALVGNPGSGKTFVAKIIMQVLHKIGAVPTPNCIEVGREDFVDRKSESRTILKTRRVLETAQGGVLFVDEAYTLLPSPARPRGRDYGPAALRELARGLSSGTPLVILAGYAADLQRILATDIGFKGNFLTRVELPDPTSSEIARMFFGKIAEKGLIAGEGLTVQYVSQLLEQSTEEEWRGERNGRIADLLLHAVRSELKNKMIGGENFSRESVSPKKLLAKPGQKLPFNVVEEVLVTVEDVQNSVMNGL